MLSIARHMDAYDIAQEVKFERLAHKGSFLIVEGDTDIKRFSKYVDEQECSLVNSYGRRKAIRAIQLLQKWKVAGVVAVLDADFDRINGTELTHPDIAYSSNHDLRLWMD
ncbi:DUF4435 domain-containing protein [Mesorhizobium sp. L48C026A00]|uniref:DUF4435 domain-containing protein n=1 Tax=Mesorhizobium sp. L48C026A00 TaxID=1287182 RepID=UPI0003CFD371|nr:DUF4435 domain-containing protein [Mesorhizobium sp. L48C026A00]ESZ11563.1 hypothetical protein X737_29430 [Mesorhizobium sp. L48C026A00]